MPKTQVMYIMHMRKKERGRDILGTIGEMDTKRMREKEGLKEEREGGMDREREREKERDKKQKQREREEGRERLGYICTCINVIKELKYMFVHVHLVILNMCISHYTTHYGGLNFIVKVLM